MSSGSAHDSQPPREFPDTTPPRSFGEHRDSISFQLGQLTSAVGILSNEIKEQGRRLEREGEKLSETIKEQAKKIEQQSGRIDELFRKAAFAEGGLQTGWTVGKVAIAGGAVLLAFLFGSEWAGLRNYLSGH